MPALESLLRALADGRFHSGEALGETLGISRAAVWKQLKKLEALGLKVHAVKGRGYRLAREVELLREDRLRDALDPEVNAQLKHIDWRLSRASTNADALAACLAGDCHGHLYLAERQTQGRGRRGRPWVSPFAGGLYLSLCWAFNEGAASLEGLSLVVGLAAEAALRDSGCRGLGLKWPNDLLLDGHKIGGVLLEISGDAAGRCQVVIGLGLNLSLVDDDALDQPWANLPNQTLAAGRNALLATLLNRLVPVLEHFAEAGFPPFRQRWNALNVHHDLDLVLTTARQRRTGTCRGVNDQGALLLETSAGVQAFHGGEVSVRLDDAGS